MLGLSVLPKQGHALSLCALTLMTLSEHLRACGLDPSDIIAHRIKLHPDDADETYRTTADLVQSGHALVYQRIQDGQVFGAAALVAGFVAQVDGTARFAGLRQLTARRAGSAPGDIVYDPEIAHLLHNFIARADAPTFYNAEDDARSDMLRDVVLHWPSRAGDILPADDATLIIEKQAN